MSILNSIALKTTNALGNAAIVGLLGLILLGSVWSVL
jgi:hypothetical protein